MSFDNYEKISNKLMPVIISPFPKKRSRDKTLNYLKKHFLCKGANNLPIISWSATLMNSFYTQNRIVCAVTRKCLHSICETTGRKLKDKDWTDFIRIVCNAGSFDCIPGEFVGQPSIFILKDAKVIEGLKRKNPGVDLEKMQRDQLEEVKLFVGKAKEIKKSGQSRNRS